MQGLSALELAISFVFTWFVILIPPIAIRAIWRKQLSKTVSITLSICLYFVNYVIFEALESQNESHLVLFVGMWVSYHIFQWKTRNTVEKITEKIPKIIESAEILEKNLNTTPNPQIIKNYDVALVRSIQLLSIIFGSILSSYLLILLLVLLFDQTIITLSDYIEEILFFNGKPIALAIGWLAIILSFFYQFKFEICQKIEISFTMRNWLKLTSWFSSLNKPYKE